MDMILDIDGKNMHCLMPETPKTQEIQPSWSPDGKKVAFITDRDGANLQNVYVYDIETKKVQRITYQAGMNFFPCWSPDGKWIMYCSMRTDNWDIWISKADGSKHYQLSKHVGDDRYPQFVPAGK